MSQAGHAGLQALGVLRVKLEAAKAYSMREDKEPDTEAIVCDMRGNSGGHFRIGERLTLGVGIRPRLCGKVCKMKESP